MARVLGYYLTLNDAFNVNTVRHIKSKTKAVEEAKALLGIKKIKTVGVVRANDKTLLLKFSLKGDKITTEKH